MRALLVEAEAALTLIYDSEFATRWDDDAAARLCPTVIRLRQVLGISRKVAPTPGTPIARSLDRPIEDLELSVRAFGCLKRAAPPIRTIRDLVLRTDADLLAIKHFGKRSLVEVRVILQEIGLNLGMQDAPAGDSPADAEPCRGEEGAFTP
jgi:DNA-directed RNA polymerase alpha subunit